jgi:hypothetical protein
LPAVSGRIQEETEIKPKPMVEIGARRATDLVVAMNSVYLEEIGGALSELDVDGRLEAV